MSSESQSQTGLATLNEAYTDSEGEAESDKDIDIDYKSTTPTKEDSPSSNGSNPFSMYENERKPHSKLVSYSTEPYEEEGDSDSNESKSSYDDQRGDSSPEHKIMPTGIPPLSPVSFHRGLLNKKKEEIVLPSEPTGRCSKSLQEKIGELYEKKKLGKDMNASIQRRKDFRNPSIYEKLIHFCNIDEQGTNYPPETYDPHCWGAESFYEELAKRQKEEMDKREKEKKERTKVEFISGTVKKSAAETNADAAKRKSKWDVGISQMPASALKPAALVTPSILQVPTGTKPTVISAFGTITKKSKQ